MRSFVGGWLVLVLLVGCGSTTELAGVKNVHTVTPGTLVRGGQPEGEDWAALQRAYGIRTVVNLNDKTAGFHREEIERLGMRYFAFPTQAHDIDDEALLGFLRVAAAEEEHGPVYVHCQQGMDRTGAAVAAYRIVHQSWTAESAMEELRRYQAFGHTLFFRNIPPLIRGIERDREAWQAAVSREPAGSKGHEERAAADGPGPILD